MNEREKLQQAIKALDAQRTLLGDTVVDASLAALREKLATLSETAMVERQRKQVTILFADVVESTRMGGSRDPETVFEIMDGALRAFGQVVKRHEGMVARLMGDGLLAFFGAPTAREDDPVRAVRAGLGIIEAAAEYAVQAEERWGILGFAVRVGIHTGLAALGELGGEAGAEYTAMGNTTNMAARLQSAAPAQGLLISHDTFILVRGLFETERQEPLYVKGKDEAVISYLVRRSKQRSFRQGRRGVEGIETTMVGRDYELAQLQNAMDNWLEFRGMRSFIIVGDAGVGKSRLLHEFENWLGRIPHRLSTFKGRASLDMQGSPNGLLRDVAAQRFQIQDSDSVAVVRRKLTIGMLRSPDAKQSETMRAHIVGQWLGFDFSESIYLEPLLGDARQLHDRALIYLAEFLAPAEALNPSILLLEDLHWADGSSLDALNVILPEIVAQPVFVVATARPGLFRRRPDYGQTWPGCQRMTLGALAARDSQTLVQDILQRVEYVPDELYQLIVERAEGNPFYIEELIKMLVEDGVIIKGQEQWRVEARQLTHVGVPATLTGVIQARLDGLAAPERVVLQQASVVGRRFWDDVVCHLGAAAGQQLQLESIRRRLQALQEREFVFSREQSTVAEADEYIFKHATLRDVAYESVIRRLRQAYHQLAAEWLIDRLGGRLDENAALIAEHLELAGERENAVYYWRRAGKKATLQYANEEAISCYSRALELMPVEEQRARYEVLKAREGLYDLRGRHDLRREDLQTMKALAEAMDDTKLQGEAALREADLAWTLVDHQETLAAVRRAIVLGKRDEDVGLEATANLYWARVLLRQGQYEAANSHLDRALSLSDTSDLLQVRADCLRAKGIVAYFRGDYENASDCWHETLMICRRKDLLDRRGEAMTLNNLGGMYADLGDMAAAIAYGEQALAVSREIGSPDGECSALGNLGSFILDQGDYAAAIPYLEQSVEKSRRIGEKYYEANGLANLGSAYMHLGDAVRAQQFFRLAIMLYEEIEDQRGQSNLLNLLGLMQLWMGDPEGARGSLDQALSIGREIGSLNSQAQTLTFLGNVYLDLAKADLALAAGQEAESLLGELGEQHLTPDALAVQALAQLQEGDVERAQKVVQKISQRLADVPPARGIEFCQVHYACFQVLRASGQPGADAYLRRAYERLCELADRIENPEQRTRFLENIPTNRKIERAWREVSLRSAGQEGDDER